MPFELPEFKRCCFFLPLRRGLIGWGYIRLVILLENIDWIIHPIVNPDGYEYKHTDVLDVLATVFFGLASLFLLLFSRTPLVVVSVVVIISLLLFDIGFTIVLIIAGHMKSAKLMQISFIYSVVWLNLVLAVGMCVTAGSFRYIFDEWASGMYGRELSTLLTSSVILFSITFVNVYVILLIRSEVKKLRNQSLEVQFVNNAVEGKAACIRAAIDQYDV